MTTKASVNKQIATLNKLFENSKYRWKLQEAYWGVKEVVPAMRLMLQVDKKDHQSIGIWPTDAAGKYLDDISTVVGSMVMGIEWFKIK